MQGKAPELRETGRSGEGHLYFAMEIHFFQSLLAGKGSCDWQHQGGISSLQEPGLTHHLPCDTPGPAVPRGAPKKEENWDFIFTALCVLVVICEGKKNPLKFGGGR